MFLLAFVIIFIPKTFLFDLVWVDGASMEPTMHNRDLLFINKFEDVERGEVVIFQGSFDQRYFVKRVVGMPHDTVAIKEGYVYVNGEPLPEPYIDREQHIKDGLIMADMEEQTIPADSYFVMGDNRFNSKDSRNGLGLMLDDHVVGVEKHIFTLPSSIISLLPSK